MIKDKNIRREDIVVGRVVRTDLCSYPLLVTVGIPEYGKLFDEQGGRNRFIGTTNFGMPFFPTLANVLYVDDEPELIAKYGFENQPENEEYAGFHQPK